MGGGKDYIQPSDAPIWGSWNFTVGQVFGAGAFGALLFGARVVLNARRAPSIALVNAINGARDHSSLVRMRENARLFNAAAK